MGCQHVSRRPRLHASSTKLGTSAGNDGDGDEPGAQGSAATGKFRVSGKEQQAPTAKARYPTRWTQCIYRIYATPIGHRPWKLYGQLLNGLSLFAASMTLKLTTQPAQKGLATLSF